MPLVLVAWLAAGCIENRAVEWAQAMYPGLTCTPLETTTGCGPNSDDVAMCRNKTHTFQCVYQENRGRKCEKIGDIPAELQ